MAWTAIFSLIISSITKSISITLSATLFLYYILFVCQKPKIYSGSPNLLRFLRRYVESSEGTFRPAFLLWGGRLQTIFGMKRLSNSPKLPYEREILTLSDGGKVALDFLHPPKKPTTRGCDEGSQRQLMVILLPGLASSSQTGYVKAIAKSIVQNGGASVVVLNSRGIGGVPLETPRVFSATDCEDLREAVEYLKKTKPSTRFMALGTSMGGIILTHYLIKYPEAAKKDLITALIISVVWDPWCSCRNLEKGINSRILNYPLAKSLLYVATKHQKILESEDCFDLSKMRMCKTLREVDECYTAPLCGYKSLDDYYQHARIQQRVDELPIPVVALNASDDPMSPEAALPIEGAKECKNLALVVTQRGGHLGFLEGFWPKGTSMHFMDRFVSQYVRGVNLFPEELMQKDVHDLGGY